MPRSGSRVRVSFAAPTLEQITTTSYRACPGGGMVDALVSGASVERRAGSSPVLGTEKLSLETSNMERWRNW